MKFLRSIGRPFVKLFQAVTAATAVLSAPIGFREILLFGGAVLLSAGSWMVYPPAAFIVPGTILVFVAVFGTA